jgi:hypothetical protein
VLPSSGVIDNDRNANKAAALPAERAPANAMQTGNLDLAASDLTAECELI